MNPLRTIKMRGEERELLITPSLFRIAKDRNWVIEVNNPEDLIEVAEAYHKLIYCALINAHEVRKWDGKQGELGVTLMDVEVWIIENPKEFGELLNDFVLILTGKDLTELADESEKKKEKKLSLWSGIMMRLRRFW